MRRYQQLITRWLDAIGETDQRTRRDLLAKAARDPRARAYLLEQAAQTHHYLEHVTDDDRRD